MKAGDLMTTGAATIRDDAPVVNAARMMSEHRISGLPVVDAQGKLVGIITEGDFLGADEGRGPRLVDVLTGTMSPGELLTRRVADIMTPDPVTAGIETTVEEVVALMRDNKVKRLPIVTEGRVVGILSRANLVMALVRKAWSHPRDAR